MNFRARLLWTMRKLGEPEMDAVRASVVGVWSVLADEEGKKV